VARGGGPPVNSLVAPCKEPAGHCANLPAAQCRADRGHAGGRADV